MVLKILLCFSLLVSHPVYAAEVRDNRTALALQAIMQSDLGREYTAYLFESRPWSETAEIAKDIAARIYRGREKALMALSAIQLLSDFYYRSGRMGPAQNQKLVFLQSELFKAKSTVETYPGKGFAYIAIIVVLLMLPFGSPLFRSAAKKLVTTGAISAGELFSARIFSGYSLWFATRRAFEILGPISVVYFFWFDWKEKASSHSVDDEIVAPNSEARFTQFLVDLQKL